MCPVHCAALYGYLLSARCRHTTNFRAKIRTFISLISLLFLPKPAALDVYRLDTSRYIVNVSVSSHNLVRVKIVHQIRTVEKCVLAPYD